ncbi:MAG: hypothetical protein IJ385_04630 [Ruminiclostridium sp.]|nr:hypothetical protein [Ruminiclostridium sp.]
MENKETFSYTYSARDTEEIKKIREKYVPKETDKLEQLRRLDQSVTRKGTIISLVIGIIGALVMGFGMSCCMVMTNLFVLGIITGIIGIAAVAAAYPIYNYVTKKEREKIAPEIIRLTDELMK